MEQALRDTLPLALGVAVSPVPIVATILMLGGPRARTNGPSFLAGWVTGLTAVGGIALAIVGASGSLSHAASAPASAVSLVLGVLLLFVAAMQWRPRRPPHGTTGISRWLEAVDRLRVGGAFALGAVLSGLNPKVVLLTLSAVTAISGAALPTMDEVWILALFIALGTVGVLVPILVFFGMGARSAPLLERWKTWLSAHSTVVVTVLLVVIGLKLTADGITGLT